MLSVGTLINSPDHVHFHQCLLMCDVKVSLTFSSLSLVLLCQLFYLFCSGIVINTVIVTAGNVEL